jgi:hypothetical protein
MYVACLRVSRVACICFFSNQERRWRFFAHQPKSDNILNVVLEINLISFVLNEFM